MKIRNGFVTNSSSSSFVVLEMTNKVFAKIIEKYKEYLEEDCWYRIDMEDADVNISIDEGYAEVPTTMENLFLAILEILGYDVDDCEAEDDQNLPAIEIVNEDNWRDALYRDIVKNRNEILEAVEVVNFAVEDCGWQGDSDSRYNQDNYDKETLQEIFSEIAEKKGCEVSEVNNDDFNEYVSDKISIESTSFHYSKETDTITTSHSFIVE